MKHKEQVYFSLHIMLLPHWWCSFFLAERHTDRNKTHLEMFQKYDRISKYHLTSALYTCKNNLREAFIIRLSLPCSIDTGWGWQQLVTINIKQSFSLSCGPVHIEKQLNINGLHLCNYISLSVTYKVVVFSLNSWYKWSTSAGADL